MNSKNNIHQTILLNRDGTVAHSTDNIFNASKFINKDITKYIPFLESIFKELRALHSNSAPIRFSKIENPFSELQGGFDFTFSHIKNKDGEFILWSIYDYTDLYVRIKTSQQKRHEMDLKKERLSDRKRTK